jgi:hypothetical protein
MREITEDEWLTSSDGLTLRTPDFPCSFRKSLLIVAGCLRRSKPLTGVKPPSVTVEDAELLADGLPSAFDPLKTRIGNGMSGGSQEFMDVHVAPCPTESQLLDGRGYTDEEWAFSLSGTCAKATVAAIIRDVVGNPFRPAPLCWCGGKLAVLTPLTLEEARTQSRGNLWSVGKSKVTYETDPAQGWLAWNGGTILKVAQAIYDDRRFEDMPILADALEEAGCTNEGILSHCRGSGEHVRGCWVVDLILGKS